MESLSVIQIVILATLAFSFTIHLIYQLFYIFRFNKIKKQTSDNKLQAISIVICSKNNAEDLKENLPYFLEQDYPNYEVIVVNDGCVDDTDIVIKALQNKYDHLRTTRIPLDERFSHNKKLAQTIGIKGAKNENIIFSNPNCKPASKLWLQNLAKNWDKSVHIGYSNFENQKKFGTNLLKNDILKRWTKAICFSSTGKTYYGNGNNMGYLKEDFFANKGFAKHSQFEAGYDHLMAYRLSKKSGSSTYISPESKVFLPTRNPFEIWANEQKYYYQSRKYISKKIKFLLDLDSTSHFFLYLSMVFCLIFTNLYLITALVFLTCIFIAGIRFKIISSNLKEENLFLSSYICGMIIPLWKVSYYFKSLIQRKRF